MCMLQGHGITESVIRDYLVESLSASGILTSYQHGFTKGRSCARDLLVAFETWTKWLDEGFGVDIIIYLDKFWSNQEVICNYHSEIQGTGS